MPNTSEIHYIRGKLFWPKVLGEPVDNYEKTGREWAFDLSLDADGVRQMNAIKNGGKPVKNIKEKDDERGKFVSFRQRYREDSPLELEKQRISVMDANGKPWNQDTKIGNETVADLKFKVVDYGKGKYPGVYPMAIRVLDHVAYADQAFAPLSSDDEYYRDDAYKMTPEEDASFRKDFHLPEAADDLDDDVPN